MPKDPVPEKSLLTNEERADLRAALEKFDDLAEAESDEREHLAKQLDLTRGLVEFVHRFPSEDPDGDPVEEVLKEQADRVRSAADLLLKAQRTLESFMDEMDSVHPDWLRKRCMSSPCPVLRPL